MKTLLNCLLLSTTLFSAAASAITYPEITQGLTVTYKGRMKCDGTNPFGRSKKTLTVTELRADRSYDIFTLDTGRDGFGFWRIKDNEVMTAAMRTYREDMLSPGNCFSQGGDFVTIEIGDEQVPTCKFSVNYPTVIYTYYYADKFSLPVKLEGKSIWQAACDGYTNSVTIETTK